MKGLLLKLNEGFKSYDHLKLPFMSKKIENLHWQVFKVSLWKCGTNAQFRGLCRISEKKYILKTVNQSYIILEGRYYE